MRLRIREIREAKKISQAELAEKLDISRPYLSQIERGQRQLKLEMQAGIAAILGVDPVDLVDFKAPGASDEDLLLTAFRALSKERRRGWLDMAKATLAEERLPGSD